LFNESGLVGKHSHTKFVPEMVFTGGRNAWAGFLSGFFDTDGSIRPLTGKQTPALYWASTSIELLKGCQHLLSMLGVQSAIYKMYPGGPKIVMGMMCEAKESWGLYVTSISQLKKLVKILSLSHDKKADRLRTYANLGESRYRESVFEYDRVISIEDIGKGETIGVEIEGCHTHITNGIITHNSRQFHISEIARWYNLPPHKLKDLSRSSFNNIESEQISFVTDSVLPVLIRVEQCYNMQLLTKPERYQQNIFTRHNVDGLLRGDSKARAEFYRIMWNIGAMSINEVRQKEGQDAVENGDERFIPLNMIPLSKIDQYLEQQNKSKQPEQIEPTKPPEEVKNLAVLNQTRRTKNVNIS
jgi:hypothetical protein